MDVEHQESERRERRDALKAYEAIWRRMHSAPPSEVAKMMPERNAAKARLDVAERAYRKVMRQMQTRTDVKF